LFFASTILSGLAAYYSIIRLNPELESYYVTSLGTWVADLRVWFAFLIEVAIGLRAAVAVSSERERGTWDALLTSTMSGREIVLGKLSGSLYSLRWLFITAFWAWSLCVVFGAIAWREYWSALVQVVVISTFMAAVGVRASLASPTATRAMSITAGVWLTAL